MKRNYIAPAVFVIVAENGNLLQSSPNVGYDGGDGSFDKEGGETIENGGENSGATPALRRSASLNCEWVALAG